MPITEEIFRELLKRPEGDTLDFKAEMYSPDAEGGVALLKDVIALANTPRHGSAYLVFGVAWKPGVPANAIGMAAQIDDVSLIDRLGRDQVSPLPPSIQYHPFLLHGKHYGVIEIPPEQSVGPFYPTKDFLGNKLLKDVLYVRNGSVNVRANLEHQRRVYVWFDRMSVGGSGTENEQWARFMDATDSLDPSRQFILIADRLNDEAPLAAGLGQLPLLAVLDFDPSSETHGLLHALRPALELTRSVQIAIKGDRPPIHMRNQTVWYFARGLVGRYGTEVPGEPKAWIQQYGREVDQFVEHIAKAILPSPLTAIVLWQDVSTSKLLATVLDSFLKGFGDAAKVVTITREPKVEDVVSTYESTTVSLDLKALSDGVSCVLARRRNTGTSFSIPTRDGAPQTLTEEDRLWLEEELEVAHLDAWREGPDHPEPFRRGETISWRDLSLRHDCERSATAALCERIKADLRDRSATRINLYHPAGAGGTTVARRVMWEVHQQFPAVALRHLVPTQTAARLTKLASLTQNAVLCVVDGGQYRESEISDLYTLLRGQQTPVVLLQVVRRFKKQTIVAPPAGSPQRGFWIPLELDAAEAERFRVVYSQAMPSRSPLFETASKSTDARTRSAFYFGLVAYGREFHGLASYITARINGLTEVQRKVLGCFALGHHYGQQAISAQCFAHLLGIPRDRTVNLEKAMPSETMELLVPAGPDSYRTSHNLIAEELIRQLLSSTAPADDKSWRQQLSAFAVEFAKTMRGDLQVPGEQIIDLVSRVFVVRDNSELLGTEGSAQPKYAQLIEDIHSVHGQMEVLEQLAQLFPEEAHFHAHLGRFCGLNGRIGEALKAVDRAIVLSPKDPVLHHMRGMTFRYQIRQLMDASAPLSDVIPLAKKAGEAFTLSRDLKPENQHAYISDVQTLVRVLDYAAKVSKVAVNTLVYAPASDPFLREAFDTCEDLMSQLEERRGGDRPSEYELDCRAKLDAVHGDHTRALQGWQSLLERKEVSKPPIRRQIVWTHLNRVNGTWGKMRTKDADRCRQLLSENLTEHANDTASMRLWLQAVRHGSDRPSLNTLIERVTYWKSNTGSLDAAFYLFVLNSLAAIEGSAIARDDALRALEECRQLARFRQKRTWSYEWLGMGTGISSLVHQSDLGEWSGDFFENVNLLAKVSGRVAEINAPQQGKIELIGGLPAFFVPVIARLEPGRDENRQIKCFVGFSYDGLRAWQVEPT